MEVYKRIKVDLIWFLLTIFILKTVFHYLPIGRDSTDGYERSGMILRVDALSGCHYLESEHGGLTPRLGADGRQLCNMRTN